MLLPLPLPFPLPLVNSCALFLSPSSEVDSFARARNSGSGGGHSVLGLNRNPYAGTMSVSVFSSIDGIECVRSHHGEINMAPAGAGSPASRIKHRSARTSPPPAESPARVILAGSTGRCLAPGGGRMR